MNGAKAQLPDIHYFDFSSPSAQRYEVRWKNRGATPGYEFTRRC